MMYVENLGEALRQDLLQGSMVRTPCILAGLGLSPLPAAKIIYRAACKCFMNPLLFLLYLYKHFGKTPLKSTETDFCVNDRLILSAITYLALPRTMLELHVRLPIFSPRPPTFYPAVKRMKKKTYTSPYLEPLPFLKHCYKEEEKTEIKLRKEYLNKIKLQKALEEQEKKIELELITGRRTIQPMVHSKKPDANDQIQIMMENQVPTRTSLRPDKKYPMPSWKHKKKSYCDKKKRQKPRSVLPSTCGSSICVDKNISKSSDNITSFVSSDTPVMKESSQPSHLDNATASEIEIFEGGDLSESKEDDKGEQFQSKSQDSAAKKGLLENKMSEVSDEVLREKIHKILSEGVESTEMEDISDVSDEEYDKNHNDDKEEEEEEEEEEEGKNSHEDSELLYVGMECVESAVVPPIDMFLENIDTSISQKRTYAKPIFLTLEDQFPRPSWGYKDYTIQPLFSTNVCGYVPKVEAQQTEIKSIKKVDSEAFLHWKCMQLPEPISTIPTIKATITGYWQHHLYSFRAPKLMPDDIETLKKGGEDIFRILAKKSLDDMAHHGNPLASLPNVQYLPEIRQLIRARVNFKLTETIKDKLMKKSLGMWGRTIGQPRREKLIELELKRRKWTWDHISILKKMVHKHAFEYRHRVRQALLDDVRDHWASMFMDYFNNPRFKNVFFAYLPSKEDDILYPIP